MIYGRFSVDGPKCCENGSVDAGQSMDLRSVSKTCIKDWNIRLTIEVRNIQQYPTIAAFKGNLISSFYLRFILFLFYFLLFYT